MLTLQFKGDLENLESLTFADSEQEPFYFAFELECQGCRSLHANVVEFSKYSSESVQGSRGEANFIMKCKECGKEGNINVASKTYGVYTAGSNFTDMATFDSRGWSIARYIPKNKFVAVGADSGAKFDVEFDDGEWYDYDEKEAREVSITNSEWKIIKTK